MKAAAICETCVLSEGPSCRQTSLGFVLACGVFVYAACPLLARANAQSAPSPGASPNHHQAARESASTSFTSDLAGKAESPVQVRTFAVSAEDELLSLLEQERSLLEYFGPDYYKVRQVRARIEAVREFLAAQKVEQARHGLTAASPATPLSVPSKAVKRPEPGPVLAAATKETAPAPEPDRRNPPTSTLADTSRVQGGGASGTQAKRERSLPGAGENQAVEKQRADAVAVTLFSGPAILSIASIVIGLLLGLLVHFFAFFWMIRRLGSRGNPLFSLELGG